MPSPASLAMYDDLAWRHAVDAWWPGLARHLRHHGIDGVPDRLDRTKPPDRIWLADELLLAQTCGLPYRLELMSRVRLLGRPSYAIDGCPKGHYRAAIISRFADPLGNEMLRPVVNAWNSHSGRTALSMFIVENRPDGRMAPPIVSGSHRSSIDCLLRGEADIASIDAVTLALLDRFDPGHRDGLHIIAWSEPVAALPLVSSLRRSDEETSRLMRGIAAAFEDPSLKAVRKALLLDGWLGASPDDYLPHERQYLASRHILAD